MKYFYYTIGVLAAIGILIVIGLRLFVKTPTTANHAVTIATTSPEAFGVLSQRLNTTQSAAVPTSTKTALDSANGSIAAPTVVPTYTEFTYSGVLPTIPNTPVLKRSVSTDTAGVMQDILKRSVGWMDLSSFSSLHPNSMTFSEAGNTGYQITIDWQSGLSSLYKTSSPMALNTSGVIGNTNIQVLPNADSISLARAFLSDHGISTTLYGAPVVLATNGIVPLVMNSREVSYPSVITVVYPWVINNTPVVDQSGQLYGLTVMIDVGSKTVVGVQNISDLTFTSSTYPMVSDSKTILQAVKNGGPYGSPTPAGATAVTVPLQAPEFVYLLSYEQTSTATNDILVPAWKFPLGTVPSTATVYQTSIVVPLVADLLTNVKVGSGGSGIVPPAASDAPTSTSSGSSTGNANVR